MEIIIAVAAAPPCLSTAFTNSPILPILLVLPQFLPCQFLRFPPAIAGWSLFSAFSSVFWESSFLCGKSRHGTPLSFYRRPLRHRLADRSYHDRMRQLYRQSRSAFEIIISFEACCVKYLLFISFPCSFLMKTIYALCL